MCSIKTVYQTLMQMLRVQLSHNALSLFHAVRLRMDALYPQLSQLNFVSRCRVSVKLI